jgi:hypothetical protein
MKTGPGQRLFTVNINTAVVLSNFDIFAQAGGAFAAVNRSFPVAVTDGVLKIAFVNGAVDSPLINGIEIAQAVNASPIRVNCGGLGVLDSAGNQWLPDFGYIGGQTYTVTNAIAGTPVQAIYKTSRWGSFSYIFPVLNGKYQVTLKFAELSKTAVGQRVFTVFINGTRVLADMDIIASAGAPFKAVDEVFPVIVKNGSISITSQPYGVGKDFPSINAIEILPLP